MVANAFHPIPTIINNNISFTIKGFFSLIETSTKTTPDSIRIAEKR
jgi:hypothetical protein